MKARIAAAGLGLLIAALLPVGVATAATARPPHARLRARADATTVRGQPVGVHVRLLDASGKPIPGATVRLLTTVTFLGTHRDEVMAEAVTDVGGRAILSFSPAEVGTTTVTARWEGDPQHGPAKTSLTLVVQRSAVSYHAPVVGIQVPWARSSLILVPVVGVWVIYVVVFAQVRRIRRLAPGAPGSAR